MSERIRLLIAEDNKVLAENLYAYMDAQPEIEVVGVAENAEIALQLVQSTQPTALITDLIMPRSGWIPAARETCKRPVWKNARDHRPLCVGQRGPSSPAPWSLEPSTIWSSRFIWSLSISACWIFSICAR